MKDRHPDKHLSVMLLVTDFVLNFKFEILSLHFGPEIAGYLDTLSLLSLQVEQWQPFPCQENKKKMQKPSEKFRNIFNFELEPLMETRKTPKTHQF